MTNDETLAALERAAARLEMGSIAGPDNDDAALIRAHIETLRTGGERAQIVAWLQARDGMYGGHASGSLFFMLADAIASGAHLAGPRVLSVNVVQREGE